MPLINFPNIPQVPGVPQLLRQLGGPQVSQITQQFAGASDLLHRIPGVTDFLSASPTATIEQLFAQVPGVKSVMSSLPSFSQILKLPTFDSLAGPAESVVLFADDPGISDSSSDPKWGIYDKNGAAIAIADSFVSLEFNKEWAISKNPVAPNSFSAYNKVERPYEARVPFAKGGSEFDRGTFLLDIIDATKSIDLFSVVTPELTYINANLIGYSYERRAEKGVNLLIVEIRIEQVRVSATTTFSNTKSPVSNSAVNGGTVQPKAPTTTLQQLGAAALAEERSLR